MRGIELPGDYLYSSGRSELRLWICETELLWRRTDRPAKKEVGLTKLKLLQKQKIHKMFNSWLQERNGSRPADRTSTITASRRILSDARLHDNTIKRFISPHYADCCGVKLSQVRVMSKRVEHIH